MGGLSNEDGRGLEKATGPSSGERGEAKVSICEAEGWQGESWDQGE